MWLDPLPARVPAHKRQAEPKHRYECVQVHGAIFFDTRIGPADVFRVRFDANTKSEARAALKRHLAAKGLRLNRLPPYTQLAQVS